MALLILLFVAAALIIMAMWLGQEAGQFVIRVQNGDVEKSIALNTRLEKGTGKRYQGQKSLVANGMDNMTDYSPKYFLEADGGTLRKLSQPNPGGDGFTNHDDNALYIYTFYILNTSTSGGVGVNVSLSYSNVTKHLDEIVRVLTYYETYNISDPNVYQKPDDIEKIKTGEKTKEKYKDITSINYDAYILTPSPFQITNNGNGTVFDNQTINIGYGEGQDYVKYTIMFWLEGDDPDSDYYGNELLSGTIKFDMTIKVSM
jgi:hypothetical protein